MLLRSWLLLLAVCSAGCSGPKINYCILGSEEGMACARSKPIPYSQSDDWRCISPDDQYKMLRDCKLGAGLPDLNYCILYTDHGFQTTGDTSGFCVDGSMRSLADMPNWVCVSPRDGDRLLLYCKRKRDGD